MKTKSLSVPFIMIAVSAALIGNAQQGVTKFGLNALQHNSSSGIYNSAFGHYALSTNSTGTKNTAFGANTLRASTTASYNTAMGYASLYQNTTGYENTATGHYSMFSNVGGFYNTAYGTYALQANTSGYDNTAIGYSSMFSNTDQSYNTAMGAFTLYKNVDGWSNTAIGYRTLYYNTSGNSNTGVGHGTLYLTTTGSANSAIGRYSLYSNTSGSFNTAQGYHSLYQNTTGSFNTAIGYNADVSASFLSNATAIGYNAIADASNKVRIGNTSVTSIGGQVGWTIFSDGRYKRNIKEDVAGLEFIKALRPVTYTLNVQGLNARNNPEKKQTTEDDAKAVADRDTEMDKASDDASKIVYSGFIAQEVEAAAKKLNYEFSGVDKPQTKDGLYGLRYDNFIVPLVKAVQELVKLNDELKEQNNELQSRVAKLEERSTAANSPVVSDKVLPARNDASIDQNAPNPFSGSTSIRYRLPGSVRNAQLVVSNAAGVIVKTISINGKSAGEVSISAGELAPGSYYYTLLADGKKTGTKQMMVLK